MKVIAEYIWVDGQRPTADIRSKTKIIDSFSLEEFEAPIWGFDGSSTNQAEGHDSDCVLIPVGIYIDPIRKYETFPSVLVLSEVHVPERGPHESNTRAKLVEAVERDQGVHQFIFGIEQEYTFFKDCRPLGFPERGYPEPQGKYYCGIGADKLFGHDIAEKHLVACIKAGIPYSGRNAEVMPGQWEFQIGAGEPLEVADGLVVARWLLHRLAMDYGVTVSFAPKPAKGDWNGAGAHINLSTKEMRESYEAIQDAVVKLKRVHDEHIALYGHGIEERLTGKHETCPYNEFRSGVSDRGASIRIPWQVGINKKGYIEDRRPCANIDPYVALEKIMATLTE